VLEVVQIGQVEGVEGIFLPRPPRQLPRKILFILLFGTMAAFSAFPIANHLFRPAGENKDYDIWYKAGRIVLEGNDLYTAREQSGQRVFEFMYPPAAAIFLAPLTALGKLPFLVSLDLVNSLSWIVCLYLAVRLAESMGARASIALYVFPAVCTVAYVYDAYLLGQPNLMLLACLLAAFVALQQKKERTAGALLAFATACKAFPLLTLGYLVYRRHWRAACAMVAFLALLMVVLPATVRGVSRTARELQTWTGGMLLHYDNDSIAQRPGTSYEWKNASLLAITHRLLRHVPAELPDNGDPVYVNIADRSFRDVSRVAVVLAAVLCLACVFLSPAQLMRTKATDAIEFAMLLVLITILSPISWFYYGVWLLYPFTVVAQFIRSLPKASMTKKTAVAGIAVCLLLLNAVFPCLGTVRAIGTPFFGYVLLLLELGWILWLTKTSTTRTEIVGLHAGTSTHWSEFGHLA
jgi:hypothetical protein